MDGSPSRGMLQSHKSITGNVLEADLTSTSYLAGYTLALPAATRNFRCSNLLCRRDNPHPPVPRRLRPYANLPGSQQEVLHTLLPQSRAHRRRSARVFSFSFPVPLSRFRYLDASAFECFLQFLPGRAQRRDLKSFVEQRKRRVFACGDLGGLAAVQPPRQDPLQLPTQCHHICVPRHG